MNATSLFQQAFRSLYEWDKSLFLKVQAHRLRRFDRLMVGFTRAGDWQTWTLLGAVGLLAGGSLRELSITLTPRILGAFMFCRVLKRFANRPRPSAVLADWSPLLKNPDPYSFPSAHSACAWSVAIGLTLHPLTWAFAPLWLLYAAGISFSRIHVGAHFPGDVLAGVIIGSLAGAL